MKQPQPLLTRAGIITALAVLSSLLVHLGLGNVASALDSYVDPLAAVILSVAPLVSAYLGRRHVTPVAAPRDNDGNELVPAGSAPAVLDAAIALAEANEIHPV